MSLPIDISRLCIIYAVEPLYGFIDIIPREISNNIDNVIKIIDNPKAYKHIKKLINLYFSRFVDEKITEKKMKSILQTSIWNNPHPKVFKMVLKLKDFFDVSCSKYTWMLLTNTNKQANYEAGHYVFKLYEGRFSLDTLSKLAMHLNDPKYIQSCLESKKREGRDDEYEILCESISRNKNDNVVKFLLSSGYKYIRWPDFSTNSSDIAVDYLFEHWDKIYWAYIQANTNPRALKGFIQLFLQTFFEYKAKNKNIDLTDYISKRLGEYLNIDPLALGSNPTFIDFLDETPELIDLIESNIEHLSSNPNPKLIKLLNDSPEYSSEISFEDLIKCNHGVLQNTYGLRFINKLIQIIGFLFITQ